MIIPFCLCTRLLPLCHLFYLNQIYVWWVPNYSFSISELTFVVITNNKSTLWHVASEIRIHLNARIKTYTSNLDTTECYHITVVTLHEFTFTMVINLVQHILLWPALCDLCLCTRLLLCQLLTIFSITRLTLFWLTNK